MGPRYDPAPSAAVARLVAGEPARGQRGGERGQEASAVAVRSRSRPRAGARVVELAMQSGGAVFGVGRVLLGLALPAGRAR
ncbi:hypothetical protein [Actinoplanes sp. NPDC049681]|uniref:hypothetical protein n=1 Tax=Actinoplanes sp. NPDC049681 TaxID=3363905 RepID=UPI00378E67B2